MNFTYEFRNNILFCETKIVKALLKISLCDEGILGRFTATNFCDLEEKKTLRVNFSKNVTDCKN